MNFPEANSTMTRDLIPVTNHHGGLPLPALFAPDAGA